MGDFLQTSGEEMAGRRGFAPFMRHSRNRHTVREMAVPESVLAANPTFTPTEGC